MSESAPSTVVLSALRRVLTPLARLMLARGVTLPMAIELLKRVFVEVAAKDFALDKKTVTDSRISLLTGVHRKDVRRLRDLDDPAADLPPKISLGAQVVASWTTDQRWLDENGRPRALSRLARHGGPQSFENLVSSVSRDIRPRSLLDEWLHLGIVEVNYHDEVILLTDAFIPRQGDEEKLAYYGHNVGDHASAATDNVLGGFPTWFERSVHHTELTPEEVAALRDRAGQLGMAMLQKLHQQAEKRTKPPAGDRRITCGVYFYSTHDSPPKESA